MEKELHLKFRGWDNWDRPVYEDDRGKLWKDVNPRAEYTAGLCSSLNNDFFGEPDTPMKAMKCYQNSIIVYEPERKTW